MDPALVLILLLHPIAALLVIREFILQRDWRKKSLELKGQERASESRRHEIEGAFFGEGEPNGADFANFGILRSMQGLNGVDIVERHEVVSSWYARMQEHSGVY